MTNQKATGERKMTDRDHFAVAALTGLIVAMRDESMSEVCESAYGWADAMLRERDRHIPDAGKKAKTPGRTVPDAWATAYAVTRACEIANHDAVPEAKAMHSRDCSGGLSGTGNTPEPVAWAVVYPNNEVAVIAFKRQDAEERASASDRIVPLCRQPQPALTDAEREAVERAISMLDGVDDLLRTWADDKRDAATLRGLLGRLGGNHAV